MAFPSPYPTTCPAEEEVCKIPGLALQVQSRVAQGFGPVSGAGPGRSPSCVNSPRPALTLTPSTSSPRRNKGPEPISVGRACPSALNHLLWPGSPSAETSSKIRMCPPGSTSSHDPEFPPRERSKSQGMWWHSGGGGEKLGAGAGAGRQQQQQGERGRGREKGILGVLEGGQKSCCCC